jgi:hypothetical protein
MPAARRSIKWSFPKLRELTIGKLPSLGRNSDISSGTDLVLVQGPLGDAVDVLRQGNQSAFCFRQCATIGSISGDRNPTSFGDCPVLKNMVGREMDCSATASKVGDSYFPAGSPAMRQISWNDSSGWMRVSLLSQH